MLSHLVEDSVEEIRLSTITQFTDFVAHIRSSHNLRALVESVKSCDYLTENAVCTESVKVRCFFHVCISKYLGIYYVLFIHMYNVSNGCQNVISNNNYIK